MPEGQPLKPVRRTLCFDAESSRYLTLLFPTGKGGGGFCSRLVLEHKLQRELAEQYAKVAAEEQWHEETGLAAIE
jgi:hypothetical protein